MVILPWPGRIRTRATAALRRPVFWHNGVPSLIFVVTFGVPVSRTGSVLGATGISRPGPGAGHVEWFGLLRLVRVLGAGVDLQLVQLLATEPGTGEHAPDGASHDLLGPLRQQIAVLLLGEATGVAAVVVHELLLGLVRGEHDLGRVDHDDVVAGVDVGGEDRLVLAPQARGHFGGQSSEHHALRVDDVPGPGDVVSFGRKSAHEEILVLYPGPGRASRRPTGSGADRGASLHTGNSCRWPARNVRRCDHPRANGGPRRGRGHSSYSTPTRHSPCGGAMTPPTRDRSPLCSSQLTSDARRRPRPTSTRAPTTERTI